MLWNVGFLEPIAVAAAVIGATRHLRVGFSALILPLHHPIRLAKAAATIDLLAGHNRLILGVGVGGENPREFDAMGIPVNERGARCNEIIVILRRLWKEGSVDHEGPKYPLQDVTLLPRPATPDGPPIWVAGRSQAAQTRAAALGDGWLPYLVSPEQLFEGLATIASKGRTTGRDLKTFVPAVQLFISVGATPRAAQRLGSFLERLYERPMKHLLEDRCLIGPPDRCTARIGEYIDAGARSLIVQVPGWGPSEREQVQLVAEAILPAVRERSAATRIPDQSI